MIHLHHKNYKRMKKIMLFLFLLLSSITRADVFHPKFSTVGFYEIEGCGRTVFNFNVAWRYSKGKISEEYKVDYNHSK